MLFNAFRKFNIQGQLFYQKFLYSLITKEILCQILNILHRISKPFEYFLESKPFEYFPWAKLMENFQKA